MTPYWKGGTVHLYKPSCLVSIFNFQGAVMILSNHPTKWFLVKSTYLNGWKETNRKLRISQKRCHPKTFRRSLFFFAPPPKKNEKNPHSSGMLVSVSFGKSRASKRSSLWLSTLEPCVTDPRDIMGGGMGWWLMAGKGFPYHPKKSPGVGYNTLED